MLCDVYFLTQNNELFTVDAVTSLAELGSTLNDGDHPKFLSNNFEMRGRFFSFSCPGVGKYEVHELNGALELC